MPVAADQSSWSKGFAQSSTTLVAEARAAESTVAAATNRKLIARQEPALAIAR
jgi:hypothetical protein